ncbi:GGDEF domain-containing protein [Actinoplanes friuliensis]|uniref:Response regulator receiver modulated diguanylate cyclase/phosphodiesterase with PAS/PAC sensor(S) n=1 Tax=Actinoplanes friuliensis DSM 7358 TaxID=1246995 RepID=U5W8A1_9ACTN|nr:GGDEF domain-containing protein [Actinoplanes friuliensis]AGZ45374.1 response regulator receiver modulated diguanylate cyclase/phosphodiesterase with PAS/PAC sensor(s) [Actinoplanes friuliensis DSM 7358]
MVLRWYAVVSFALVAGYLAVPYDLRTVPFLLVTLAALVAVVAGVRRSPVTARAPWWLLLAGLVAFNVGNLAWLWIYYLQGVTGDGTVADLFYIVANLLLLAGAMVVVVRRGRRDIGGVIDSAIIALALGGLLWDTVLLPQLTAADAPVDRQAALFVNVLVMAGSLGALLRVTLVAGERLPAMWMLSLGQVAGLVGNLSAALTIDAVTGDRADWTNVPFLAGYALLGCAALHPSAARITRPGPPPRDDLSVARLTFLGTMTALIPVVGGGRVVFGLPTDGLLIAVGSAVVIPLVMVRVSRLSTQRRRAEQALVRMATHDALTGLPNRAACLDRLTADLTGPGVAVLFCDLDGFKAVNDRLGHAAGDELLVAVADRLRACVRDQDLVSRFGGDEFVVVCRDDDPRATVDAVCARIRDMVARPIVVAGESVRIGVSVGVAFAGAASSTDDLLGHADAAMYTAKQSKSVGALSLALA